MGIQGDILCTLRVCTLGPWVWVPKPWNTVLNKGIWDLKPRVTNIKGANIKCLRHTEHYQKSVSGVEGDYVGSSSGFCSRMEPGSKTPNPNLTKPSKP